MQDVIYTAQVHYLKPNFSPESKIAATVELKEEKCEDTDWFLLRKSCVCRPKLIC